MLLDQQTLLSNEQAITATAVSTNTIDLGAAGTIPYLGGSPLNDPGRGTDIEMFAQVVADFTAAGAATLQVQLITSASANLSSPTVIQETAAIPVATLNPGYQFRLGKLPHGLTQRYLGLNYVVTTGPMTAGTITAGLVMDRSTISI